MYDGIRRIEDVIDYIEDQQLNYHRGNAIKYISRAGYKDPSTEIQDLKKAAWYINREIEMLEKQQQLNHYLDQNL